MLEDVLNLLACPHCGGPLTRVDGSVACPSGHSFDVARSGYLGLLPGDARAGSADSPEMVAAREAFLEAGHFEPLAEALAEEAERALTDDAERTGLGDRTGRRLARPPGCVIDLGAGTGRYLAQVLDRLPGRPGLALDLSKHALRRAARAHPRVGAVGCDAWRPLPVRDSVAALVLSAFAPRNGPEIARVLAPGGALVVATPTERHLAELVAELDLLSVDERKEERLEAQLGGQLALERRTPLEWTLELAAADVANAVAMGPSAHHVGREEIEARAMPATASVAISVYRAGSG